MKKLSPPPAAKKATTFFGKRNMLNKATKYLIMVLIKLRLLIEKNQRHSRAGGVCASLGKGDPAPLFRITP